MELHIRAHIITFILNNNNILYFKIEKYLQDIFLTKNHFFYFYTVQ